MKLLIVYDGSQATLSDLQKAGLPGNAEVMILSVVETWSSLEKAKEIERQSRQAQEQFGKEFPLWQITAETVYGSPAREILAKAESFRPELIAIGEHRQSLADRNIFFGNILQKVLNEARCSVRIARGKADIDPSPSRIVIGFDGSAGAQTAIDAVASRSWRRQSEVQLVVVNDSNVVSSVGHFPASAGDLCAEVKLLQQLMEKAAAIPLQKFKNAGLSATLCIKSGNSPEVLIDLAQKWQADSIFVGQNRMGSVFDRLLLGSVSAAIASRANCSVEITGNKR